MSKRWFLRGALALPLFAAGCGDSDHAHGGAGGDDHDHTTCGLQENCGRTEEVALEADLEVVGADGNLSLVVRAHNALSIDANEWTIEIVDDAGDAVADASLSVSTWSDDCGHAGPTAPEEVTTDATGMATIHPVMVHGGPWDVIVESDAAGTTDTITVPLCIPGASH
jgi:hypothetical protein